MMNGYVKISDFGISSPRSNKLGTYDFMPPGKIVLSF